MKQRCVWANPNNETYLRYHDEEWGVENFEEGYLYELFLLETFQAGLSWECVLNKREQFREAFDQFDVKQIASYDMKKVEELMQYPGIIHNRLKILASINNARIWMKLVEEYHSFHQYLLMFYDGNTIYEIMKTTSQLSDAIARDLKKREMKFVGSTTIYAYLQAIGVINSHDKNCYLYQGGNKHGI